MKRVKTSCVAAALSLILATMPIDGSAHAQSQVLESDLPDFPAGTEIADEAAVNIPDGKTLRVLIVSAGETKTLKGPYEGKIADYTEKELTWWERITGQRKDPNAPIGATRGLKPQD